MKVHRVRIRVRYAETDQMGHAHHVQHLVWCEAGRSGWLRERRMSYADLEERGVYLPVSRVEAEYLAPARYDREVEVETWVERVRSRRILFRYRLLRVEDGVQVARVATELTCVDRELRVRRLPPDLFELLEAGVQEGTTGPGTEGGLPAGGGGPGGSRDTGEALS